MEGYRQGWVVAGFGYRVAAYLFDVGLALAALTAAILAGLPGAAQFAVALGTWLFVTSVATAVFDGQTLGKRLVGTRVVSARGEPAGFGKSVLRDSVLRLLYLVPLFFVVDSVFAAASASGQTLRDRMAGTYVVREQRAPARAWGVALAAAGLLAIWVAGTSTTTDEPGEGYTSADRSAFVEGCRDEGSSAGRCACLYEFMAARLSHDEFTGVGSEDPDTWPDHVRRVADDATAACDGDQPEEPPPGSTTASARPRNLPTS